MDVISASGIILFLIVLLVLHSSRIFYRNADHVKFAASLDGPAGLPVIGNSMDFWKSGIDGVRKLSAYTKKYGHIYRLWFGSHLVVVMTDVNKLEPIFRKPETQDKPEIFLAGFKKFLGNGLSTCPISMWRKTRRSIQPLYGKKEFAHYIPEMNRIITLFVIKMRYLADGPEFNICHKLHEITFNIITKTNFDMEFSSEELSKLTIHSCNEILSEISFMTIFRAWLHIPVVYYLRYYWNQFRIKQNIRSFTQMVLEEKRKALELERQLRQVNYKFGQSSMPFLSTLYKLKDETFNDDWILDQIAFLIIAGADGMAIIMSFFLLTIAMNTSIQEKLYEELSKVLDDDRQPTYEDLERLVYLEQVLKETQRCYTFVPFILRNIDADTKIGDYIIPAESTVLINIDQIHHDPRHYPDPYTFNPENFEPKNICQRPPISFIPFSYGPRNCIAGHYANGIMKLTLVSVLKTFEFYTTMTGESMDINVGFITTSKNGYKLSVKLRNQSVTVCEKSSFINVCS